MAPKPWGDWIYSAAHGEWQQCSENQHSQVKVAQRALGTGDSLLRLRLSLKLSPATRCFALPECNERLHDPAQIFHELLALHSLGPGDMRLRLTVDPENLWYKVLAANLPDVDLLEAHEGRLMVLGGFPQPQCCTQLITSCRSDYLSRAVIAEPSDGKLLLTFLHLVPFDTLYFRLKHLARASILRAGPSLLVSLCSEALTEPYVTLSLHCQSPPVLPLRREAQASKPSDWTSCEETFAGYLERFFSIVGLHAEVCSSINGQRLRPYQAALDREQWNAVRARFLPVFQHASIAYRKLTAGKMSIYESPPEFLDDTQHVRAQLNQLDP